MSENNQRLASSIPAMLALAVVIGLFIGMAISRTGNDFGSQTQTTRTVSRLYSENKLLYTLALIDRMYVDSVDIDSLSEKTLITLLDKLDPHSTYIPAEEFERANETLDGEFDGIGVVFNMATDTIVVLNVIAGGPSDKAGVRNGDRIIMIGDSLVAGQKINQNDVIKMLRGPRGTTVDLSLQREDIKELVPVTVERDKIPVKSLDAAFMIRPGIGFVKLSAFSKNSFAEVAFALAALRKAGMEGLIFDLRDNSGGFLEQAINLANMFLPTGKMIVYTEDRFKRRVEEYSNGAGQYKELPLVILVNETSASSSEILAGAIQDNDRGLIVGRRTFGKGLVQQQVPLSDGSAIRLTIARYYTPTGRSIQKPYSGGSDEYRRDIWTRYEHQEFFTADSIKFDDSLVYRTPGGRKVYGGGGIMPDVFVPLDTTGMSRYFLEVSGRNILYRYTMKYADSHRAKLNAVRTIAQLDSLLDSDRRMLDDFVNYASRQGVKPDYAGIRQSRDLITAQIRSYVGRNSPLEDVGFYSNIYVIDNMILTAIEALRDGSAIIIPDKQ